MQVPGRSVILIVIVLYCRAFEIKKEKKKGAPTGWHKVINLVGGSIPPSPTPAFMTRREETRRAKKRQDEKR